ncbi:TOUSLED [Symbiodinium sp. CCMP2456]|nr:TOUSLED [Symbiodinium sp. CCMP2456]
MNECVQCCVAGSGPDHRLCSSPRTPKHESRSRTDEASSGPPEEEPESTETSQAAAQPLTKPKAAENRRGSKRPHPPVPSLDPDQATVSPTISRGRKHRQTLTPEHGHDPEEAGCPKEREIKRLQQELNEQKTQMQNLINLAKKGRFMLADALVENAKNEREKLRVKLFHDGVRVGRYKTNLYGAAEWENGTEADAITALRKKLQQERDSVASLKLSLTKQSKCKAIETDDADANTEETDDLMEQRGLLTSAACVAHPYHRLNVPTVSSDPWEILGRSELQMLAQPNSRAVHVEVEWRSESAHLFKARRVGWVHEQRTKARREDTIIKEREGRLMAERNAYLKNKHLVNAEDRSRFGHYPMLQDRFQLLNLIGKGGFSEIYKAFDLEMMCYCAIKLNEINSKMSNDMCKDAVRWALREAEIQKALQHPRIVQMRDCFAVDNHAFVAVLELCEGETLDTRLKSTGSFSEKEAKTIIVQILTGLRYLNSAGRKIIHYDIKPSNVFYHAGQVKICDFGLSKMANHSTEGIIELSTRGAGTSWYLPPECHETASPTISSA